MRVLLRILFVAVCVAAVADGNGQSLRTTSVFTDHMMLQQGVCVTVWGQARPGATVTLSVAGVRAEARADAQGRWTAFLPSLDYGGPYDLALSAGDTLVIHDVVVGEVWLASGQSNMEWTMGAGMGPDT